MPTHREESGADIGVPTRMALPAGPGAPAVAGFMATRLRAQVRDALGFAWHVARRARLGQVAASLTFSSVLALVPLLAVVLAILTFLPVFGQLRQSLEQELLKGLLPAPYAQTILRYLTDFAAKAAGVGLAGLVFLAASALAMILTVDRILNDIWQVRRRRTLARRILLYLGLLSAGPILLGISLSLTSLVASVSDLGLGHAAAGRRHLFAFAAPLIAAAAYSAIYALVPNRPVAWRYAVTGGVFTSLANEIMSRGFATYVTHGNILSIYGAFAAVPVFLMWIYLSWLTFLFGAALAATLPRLSTTRFTDVRRAGDRALTAVALVRVLHGARSGASVRAVSTTELARLLRSDAEWLGGLLAQLQGMGYVRRLALADERGPDEWVLSCDPQVMGLAPLFHALVVDPANSLLQRADLDLMRWVAPAVAGAWLREPLARLDYGVPPPPAPD
jgi:membrane protein